MSRENPSPAESVTQLRHVPIIDNGEPLVNFLDLCPDLFIDRPRFTYRRETMLRESVAKMLCAADAALPKGYRLTVVEGWRPPVIQRRMYAAVEKWFREENPTWSETKLRRTVNQFTAPINKKVPPPHTTGGAIDVFLANDKGEALDLTSPFKTTDTKMFTFFAKGLSEEARKNRQILWEALSSTQLTNYPSEYWHWTYGDQGWAYRGHHPHALYNAITPENWTIAPEDDTDEPLTFLEPTQNSPILEE